MKKVTHIFLVIILACPMITVGQVNNFSFLSFDFRVFVLELDFFDLVFTWFIDLSKPSLELRLRERTKTVPVVIDDRVGLPGERADDPPDLLGNLVHGTDRTR